LSARLIAQETGLQRQRILRALAVLRQRMCAEVPAVFRGTVEVDETYLGGEWKNRRASAKPLPRGRATVKTPVFGILCRQGQVWAQIVPDVSPRTLQALIRRRVRRGSVVCSDAWHAYTGLATTGYVHRCVDHRRRYVGPGPHRPHINGLEGFWGYVKRRLAAKGGIRRNRLPLYLAEYVWRYNHRHLSVDQQVHQLMQLLTHHRVTKGRE
jgi:transposase-like protein